MGIEPIGGFNLRRFLVQKPRTDEDAERIGRGRRAGKFHMPHGIEEESDDASLEQFDELDTNQDGIVDSTELKTVGIGLEDNYQSTQDFLSLLGVKTAEEMGGN